MTTKQTSVTMPVAISVSDISNCHGCPEEIWYLLGKTLSLLRTEAGYDQVELARKAYIPTDTLVQIETGEQEIQTEWVGALAQALGIEIEAVVQRAEELMADAMDPSDVIGAVLHPETK